MGGLDCRYAGKASVLGHDLHALDDAALARFRNREVGFIFQAFNLLDHLTARENVALPSLLRRGGRAGRRASRQRGARAGRHRRQGRRAPGRALGRTEAARGHRARAVPPAQAAPVRRADRQPRLRHRAADHRALPRAQRRRPDAGHRHARGARLAGGVAGVAPRGREIRSREAGRARRAGAAEPAPQPPLVRAVGVRHLGRHRLAHVLPRALGRRAPRRARSGVPRRAARGRAAEVVARGLSSPLGGLFSGLGGPRRSPRRPRRTLQARPEVKAAYAPHQPRLPGAGVGRRADHRQDRLRRAGRRGRSTRAAMAGESAGAAPFADETGRRAQACATPTPTARAASTARGTCTPARRPCRR